MPKRIFPYFCIVCLLGCVCLLVCQRQPQPETERNDAAITQIATIDSLLSGVYDGEMTLEELLKYGDFGIGTLDKLDGEMIVLDGNVYQIKADGKVYSPSLQTTTPFASVASFPKTSLKKITVHLPLDYESAREMIDESVANNNVPVVVRMTGRFSQVKARSVPAQVKPYPPLVEVTKNQPEFELGTLDGIAVGFRLPKYVQGINVPGYHLHFLSADEKCGGHLLHLKMESGTIEYAPIHHFQMILPEKTDFAKADLTQDRSQELKKVEQ